VFEIVNLCRDAQNLGGAMRHILAIRNYYDFYDFRCRTYLAGQILAAILLQRGMTLFRAKYGGPFWAFPP
jgi:hypothetical protein